MSAPSAPNIELRPWPEDGAITFYWQPPSSDGGSPIINYTLAEAAAAYTQDISAGTPFYRVSGLTNNTNYTFTLTATNAIGTSPAATFRTVQPGVLPFGPSTATVSTLNISTALITWNLSTIANEGTPKWFVVTVLPSTASISSYTKSSYIFERARTLQMPSTNIRYQFLVQAINDTGYCIPFAFTSSLGFGITTSAFSPSSLTGLSFWIDATRITGASNNQALTAWNDLSPNAYTGGASNGPTYISSGIGSNATVRFNGTSQYIDYGTNALNINTSPFHTFIVAKYNAINTAGLLMSKSLYGGGAGRYFMGKANGTTNMEYYLIGTDANTGSITSAFNLSNTSLFGFYWDRSTMFYNLNGSTITSVTYTFATALNTSFNLLVGAYNNGSGGTPGPGNPPINHYFPGDMGEIVSYLAPLTPFDRQKVEGYLAWKWGLQTSLPAVHPFRIAAPTAGSVFSPSSFSSLQLWIDAADATTVSTSVGTSSIVALRDKSANAYLFSNATGFTYNSTLFNTSYPSFYNATGGTASRLGSNTSIAMNQPITAFYVGRMLGNTLNYIHDSPTSANRFVMFSSNAQMFAGSQIAATSPVFVQNFICAANFNTTNSAGFINGSTSYATGNIGTNNIVAGTGLLLGNRFSLAESWDGHICEVLMYNRLFSTEDRQTVEGYLAWKWGLQGSLPTTHPYRNQNPAGLSNPTPYFATDFNNGNDAAFVNYATSNLSTQTQTGSGFSYRASLSNLMYKEMLVTATNTVSFCATIYRTGASFLAPVIMTRSTPEVALSLTSNGTNIGYHWNNDAGTYNYDTGYTVPLNQWVHTALTISPTQAIWYINGATVHTRNYTHAATPISNLGIALDPLYSINRPFPGLVDNVAFYATTLTSSQVYSIYASTLAPTVVQSSLQLFLDATSYAGSGTWYDQSPFGRNAGLENGTIAKNAAGNGVVFNGATNFSTTGSVMSTMNNWTASFWFKRTSTVITNGQAGCILTEIHSGASINLIVLADFTAAPGTSPSSFTGAFVTQPGDVVRSYSPAYQPTTNQWMNGTYTYDGTNMRFYINGTLSGTTNIGATSVGNSNRYRIGRRWDVGTLPNYIVGEIGQILIYNRAITAAEVGSNYNNYSTIFSV